MQAYFWVACRVCVVPESGEIAFNIGSSGLQNHIEETCNESRLVDMYACEHCSESQACVDGANCMAW